MKNFINAEIRAKDDSNENRTVQFIISTNDKDRHGTILNMSNWDLTNYNLNGIVGYNHEVYGSTNPDLILGSGRAFLEGEGDDAKLIGEVTFETEDVNPLAEKIFRKVMAGTLKATSVGFTPISVNGKYGEERGGTYYYYGQELLEFSIVNIPSNPKAVKRSAEEIEMFVSEKQDDFEGRLSVFEKILNLKK
jgi:HK97 family phage prohead protease